VITAKSQNLSQENTLAITCPLEDYNPLENTKIDFSSKKKKDRSKNPYSFSHIILKYK